MKSYWKILLFIVFAAVLFSGIIAFAQEDQTKTYTLLQPLPGMNQTMPVKAILPAYLAVLFKFMLALAGALAVLMIVFSGIMYITSGGNASQVEKAKSRIWSAIGGLVLAISAYLILYTINPNLVNLDLGIQPITLTKKAPPPSAAAEFDKIQWVLINNRDIQCQTVYRSGANPYPAGIWIDLTAEICQKELHTNPPNNEFNKWKCCGIIYDQPL